MAGIVITGDANISLLDYAVLFDMSGVGGTLPFMVVTNQSVGGNLNNCDWWIDWTSPAGNIIHAGSQGIPDFPASTPFVTFDTDNLAIIWPQPQNHIEWGIYSVTVNVYSPDTDKIYQYKKQINICAPHGNHGTAGNNYGVAKIKSAVICKEKIITAADDTLYVYQGATGVSEADYPMWLLHYPPVQDDTVIQPDDFTTTGVGSFIAPAQVNGSGHNIDFDNVVSYLLDNAITLIFRYKNRTVFSVWCNLDLQPLICAYKAYVKEFNSCKRQPEDLAKHIRLSDKMMLLFMSTSIDSNDTCCDVDIHELVEEIKMLGNFDCCCYSEGVGNTLITTNIGTQNWDQVLSQAGALTTNRSFNLATFVLSFVRAGVEVMNYSANKMTSGWNAGVQFSLDDALNKILYKTGTFNIRLDTDLLTAARDRREPNKDGTYAMLDDIPVPGTGNIFVHEGPSIDGKVVANTTIFTPTQDFMFISLYNLVEVNVGTTLQVTLNAGINSPNYDEFLSSQNIDDSIPAGEYRTYASMTQYPVVPAGTPIVLRVSSGITGTSHRFVPYIVGFYMAP